MTDAQFEKIKRGLIFHSENGIENLCTLTETSLRELLDDATKELEAQIEKMKCCGNCAKNGHICVAEEMQGKLCGKNKDKWEIKEK